MSNFREIHEELFEGATMTIGQIHKFLVTAENLFIKRNYKPMHIYRWWIKDKETNIDELEEKTRKILESLESLRDELDEQNITHNFESYPEIIQYLNAFVEDHSSIIDDLLSYVEFLNDKDQIAPYMLYHTDIWRSNKNDMVSRGQDQIPQDDPKYDEYCTEFAVGVKDGDGYLVYDSIRTNIYGDYYDSIDPEYALQSSTPDFSNQIIHRSGWEIIKRFSLFFSNLRKCMRKILEKIDEYWNKDYAEVVLEQQIKEIKKDISKKVKEDIRIKKQFNATLDNLLTIYASHQVIPLFGTGEEFDEEDFHKKVFDFLYRNLGEKVENHKKVAKGDVDFLVFNYPVDVKVEDTIQDLDEIYTAHKDQVTIYCYLRKEEVGFLFVYDNTEKDKDFSTKDFDVFQEKNYKIIVILLRGNFPYPSRMKFKK